MRLWFFEAPKHINGQYLLFSRVMAHVERFGWQWRMFATQKKSRRNELVERRWFETTMGLLRFFGWNGCLLTMKSSVWRRIWSLWCIAATTIRNDDNEGTLIEVCCICLLWPLCGAERRRFEYLKRPRTRSANRPMATSNSAMESSWLSLPSDATQSFSNPCYDTESTRVIILPAK